MRIVFVLAGGAIAPTGGFRIIAGYANELCRRGHDVTLIAPKLVGAKPKTLRGKVRQAFFRSRFVTERNGPFLEEAEISVRVVEGKRVLSAEDFPDADIVIATWWETAEWINNLSDHYAKVHFVQGYEAFPYLPVDRVRAVYELPFRKIAVSQWLRSKLINEHASTGIEVIENAIDFEVFSTPEKKKQARPAVGFLYSVAAMKNSALAIEVCGRLKERFEDLRVLSFGSHKPRGPGKTPSWLEFSENPSPQKIREIYNACDVWLFTSDEEGFGLPILEAMAAGTPVVATRAGAAPQLVHEGNGVLVDADAATITNQTEKILNLGADDWGKMSEECLKTAQRRNWKDATDDFERVLKDTLIQTQAKLTKN
ncbi:glycosyltransferase family 4 protein [Hyphococcus flavus]|uniref:Glycosyltransferase family 4 protein n=1 Tax=Hyphococcus flavus TaxID=1866326 RepID=A0AAE9ZJX7_9PROT|nr:glycosyltransferase family 4 protein [Hyphococcus flavus]WDI32496.1 glycosyltransferase family 4 protein [Hyphococcus flavus]